MPNPPQPEPPVTIGLPVYNGERYVAQSIESLLNQTFEDFQVIICDNASTDRTGEICRDFARRDHRVKYYRHETNLGMAGNYNYVFGLCQSKYFRWMPADDFLAPDMLGEAVEEMESNPDLALCYPYAYLVDASGDTLAPYKDELHLMQDDPVQRFATVITRIIRVHHHLGLMRTSVVRRTGLLGRYVSSDVAFVAEMSLYGKFSQIPKYQFFVRIHEDSSSWATQDDVHQARRYHGAGVKRVGFSQLRTLWTLAHAIRRSPLSLGDKLRAYRYLGRHARWQRDVISRELLKEARVAARTVLHRGRPSAPRKT